MSENRTCPDCGAIISTKDKFCPECGASQAQTPKIMEHYTTPINKQTQMSNTKKIIIVVVAFAIIGVNLYLFAPNLLQRFNLPNILDDTSFTPDTSNDVFTGDELGDLFDSIQPSEEEIGFEPFVEMRMGYLPNKTIEEILLDDLSKWDPVIEEINGYQTANIEINDETFTVVPYRYEDNKTALSELHIIQTQLLSEGYHFDALLHSCDAGFLFTKEANKVYIMMDYDLLVLAFSTSDDESGSTVTELGIVTYANSPKTWTITLPEDYSKVEAAIYGAGTNDTNKYGGWGASLTVNGDLAWDFLSYDSTLGGIIYDYTIDEEVLESSGRGEWLDITDQCVSGENSIQYAHSTGGDGIGLKIRVSTNP